MCILNFQTGIFKIINHSKYPNDFFSLLNQLKIYICCIFEVIKNCMSSSICRKIIRFNFSLKEKQIYFSLDCYGNFISLSKWLMKKNLIYEIYCISTANVWRINVLLMILVLAYWSWPQMMDVLNRIHS